MKHLALCQSIFLMLIGFWFMPDPGHAASPYYQGKTIEMAADARAGGGVDTLARITAFFLPGYIPGKPGIVVRNMPGGGGTNANNVFYAHGKRDGLHLMMNSQSTINLQLKRPDIAKYDLTKYEQIANLSRGSSILMVRSKALQRLHDAKADPVVCGTKEGEETWMGMALWGREFLGWNIRWIPGYSGTSDIELAFRRGEIDMFGTTTAFVIKRMIEDGAATALAQGGIFKDGKYIRRKDFPDVPTFVEVLGKKKPTGIPWQSYVAWRASGDVDQILSTPPNTPKQYTSILIDAFRNMSKDPQFDAKVKSMISEVYDVGIGQETSDLLKDALAVSPEILDYTRSLQIKFGLIAATEKRK